MARTAFRSAVTGRFVAAAQAFRDPERTVRESMRSRAVPPPYVLGDDGFVYEPAALKDPLGYPVRAWVRLTPEKAQQVRERAGVEHVAASERKMLADKVRAVFDPGATNRELQKTLMDFELGGRDGTAG